MTHAGSTMRLTALAPVLLAGAGLVACSGDPQGADTSGPMQTEIEEWPLEGAVTLDRLPAPTTANLIAGAEIWDATCRGCHGLGIADSPKITDREAWAPRIAQGKDVLYQHALEGFFGPDSAMMPPRGGNPSLSDEDVKAAVDFMVANSQ